MDSRNNPGSSKKQQDLVKRLEEIRRQRAAAEQQQTPQAVPERKREVFQETPKTQRRNEGQQRKSTTRNTPNSVRPSDSQRNGPKKRTAQRSPFARPIEQAEARTVEILEEQPKRIDVRKVVQKEQPTTKNKKNEENLITQLSSGQKLSQAFILNEVLSKPIALRKKNL